MTAQVMETHAMGDVTDAEFRAAVGRFATGVTIITTTISGADFGATVSAFSSVSNDPPTVLVCLNRTSDTAAAVAATGLFAVNVLADSQGDIAMQFAKKGQDKFARLTPARSRDGLPLIPDAHMAMECRVVEAVDGGTHTIFIGEVTQIAPHGDTQPLAYHRGSLGLFTRPDKESVRRGATSGSAQMAAYSTWFGHHDMW